VKIGDLVQYDSPLYTVEMVGIVTDILLCEDGWSMYEVVCSTPYEVGWYSDLQLKSINTN